jgi:hypothetical protein
MASRTPLDTEALTAAQAARLFGRPAGELRAVLRRRVEVGDSWPARVQGVWCAPVFWWRAALAGQPVPNPRPR